MKKPVRNIHIDGQEWHYIMGNGCAKVFPPHSKSCMAMVWYDDAPEDVPDKADAWSSEVGYRPGRLKAIIEKELVPRLSAWIEAGRPVLDSSKLNGRKVVENKLGPPVFSKSKRGPAEKLVEKWDKILKQETK